MATAYAPITGLGPIELGARKLESLEWGGAIAFATYGAQVAVRVTEPAALVAVKLWLPPVWRPAELSECGLVYSLVTEKRSTESASADRVHRLYRGHVLIAAATELNPVLGAFAADLDLQVAALAAPDVIFVRAGVVGWRGAAIVLPGRALSGKSTLVAELLYAGCSYYSDEYAVLDQTGLVHPYPRPLWLAAGGRSQAVRYRPEELGARVGSRPLRIGLVMLTRFGCEARSRLLRVPRAAGILEVMANAISGRLHLKAARAAIARGIRGALILKGVRGEAREVAEGLMAACERRPRG